MVDVMRRREVSVDAVARGDLTLQYDDRPIRDGPDDEPGDEPFDLLVAQDSSS